MKMFKRVYGLLVMIVVLATVFSSQSVKAQNKIEKSDLKVLYIGVNPVKELTEREKSRSTLARATEFRKTRTPDFEAFLKQYFNTVDIVYSEEYKEEMSAKYDVTIIDDYLPVISGGNIKDATGKIIGYEPRKYLSEEYDDATLMIGEPSAFTGEGRELKIDHLCLCLDAHAHGMKLKHPIFNKPYNVDISYEDIKLTGNYFARYTGRNLPNSLPMWRIQTEGYRDAKGFPAGVVSTGYGFDNGIDAEWISSGSCDKGIEATAIGRHSNFFHWGFATAPKYMTESAKLAFINSIHYISQFKGAKQITRKIKGSMLREYLRENQWNVSDKGAAAWLAYIEEGAEKARKMKREAQIKKDAGEKLSEVEEMILQMQISEKKETRAMTIRLEPQERKDKFGEDWAAYENFYKENMDYFYPIGTRYDTKVDEEAKVLGIPNSDIKLIETAIKMLKKGEKVEMAKCFLNRYTKETFETAVEWSKWFKKNRKNLYFSEGDGYKWIVLP